jgi:hypothetical protein
VYRRLSLRLLCLLLTLALPASAQFTRDNAANKKIDEAINEHYLATDFDKAEGVLTGTVQACGDKCSPQVIARAWMYVGIVRGSGKNDQAGAKEAFAKAISTDPQVKLDTALATPETQKTFDASGGAAGSAATPEPTPTEGPAATPAGGGEEEGPGGMKCTPDAMEIQTRRAIPVECVSDEEAASVELRYKPFGGDWKTVKMTKKGESFRGEIPCVDTKSAGDLKVYARAKDAAGETTDNWGSKNKPINYTLGESVTGEPPAFTGEAAPERCPDSSECPPDFPGCGGGGAKRGDVDWGGKCENSTECKSGLLCEGGVCETAPSCETNADCTTGVCTAGKCDVGDDVASSAGPYKKNWLGLHFGVDVAIIGGANVCGSGGGYECYDAGTTNSPYGGPPFPGTGIATGTAIATQRILLSYDRAFTPNIMAGLRAGYALGGGPPAITDFGDPSTPADDKKIAFLPVHAELRLSYWFGQGALGKKGLRPYLFIGGGMAQVDAKVAVTVFDCSSPASDGMLPRSPDCENGAQTINQTGLRQRKIDAWKKLGQGFAAGGGGIVYAFTPQLGAQLNFNFMYMLGSSGPVLEPSLGLVYGL